MKKKRRVWIFAMILVLAAVPGNIFAADQETESTAKTQKIMKAQTATEGEVLDTEAIKVSGKKSLSGEVKKVQEPVKKTTDGQTLLDVSKGNISITSAGATGGGYKQ